MKSFGALDLSGSALSKSLTAVVLPVKPTVISIRWPVVIICSYLLVYPSVTWAPPVLFRLLILLYIFTNVLFYLVPERQFRSAYFYSSVAIFDTLFLTFSLIVNGDAGTDFYLAYFLVVIVACIFEDPKIVAVIAILAPLLYGVLLFQWVEVYHPSVYLRLPFLCVVSIFYGYFAQLTRWEKTQKEKAIQKNEAKLELLSLVSHELRTPLTLISGFAQAVKSRVMGELTAEQEKSLEEILKQSGLLLSVVDRLLEVSRIEAEEVSVEKQEFILPNFLDEIRINYAGPLEKPVTVTWDYSAEAEAVRSDKEKLRIILQNLINNAIKFTEKGEVRISVLYKPEAAELEFRVSDTGMGIPKEAFPSLFERYRHVTDPSSRPYEGLGLGLYVVRAFTELLGGTISVDSEPGKGSTFTVTVPI